MPVVVGVLLLLGFILIVAVFGVVYMRSHVNQRYELVSASSLPKNVDGDEIEMHFMDEDPLKIVRSDSNNRLYKVE